LGGNGDQRRPPGAARAESVAVFLVAALVTAGVGAVAVQSDAVNWKALAALSHAQDVLRQEHTTNLALIGFVEPPLPALLQLPIAWVAPALLRKGDAVWVLGALIAGLTIALLNAICAGVGVGRAARWVFCAVALLNPVYLGMAATGAPDALYVLLLLGGAWSLLRWQRDATLRDLITASLLFGLALIARYDAVVTVIAATGVVVVQTLREKEGQAPFSRKPRTAGLPETSTCPSFPRLEGTLITFLLPIVYIGGLWVLANWVIIGDPWHFWRLAWQPNGTAGAAAISPWQGVLGAVAVFAPLPAALWWALWGGAAGRPRLAAGAAIVLLSPAVAVLAAPGLLGLWLGHAVRSDLPLLPIPELFAPLLAAGWLLTACLLGDLQPLFARKSLTKEVCLAGSAALLAFGCLLVMGPEDRVYLDFRPALHGKPFGADDAADTKRAAERLRRSPPAGTLVIAGWPGYAVTLYAARVEDKVLLVDTKPPTAPVTSVPAGGLLLRDGKPLAKDPQTWRRWQRAVRAALPSRPAWVIDGWAYYPAQVSPHRSPSPPRRALQ
jgi:hypothetical protein